MKRSFFVGVIVGTVMGSTLIVQSSANAADGFEMSDHVRTPLGKMSSGTDEDEELKAAKATAAELRGAIAAERAGGSVDAGAELTAFRTDIYDTLRDIQERMRRIDRALKAVLALVAVNPEES